MSRQAWSFVFVVLLVSSLHGSSVAFYLPGIAPIDYADGAKLEIMANRLTSVMNQLPYDYYSLPFCGADKQQNHRSKPVNLGQILVGERMHPTDYDLKMKVSQECSVLCAQSFTEDEVKKKLLPRIMQQYAVRLNLDNMPLVMRSRAQSGADTYSFGYRVGVFDEKTKKTYINNHLKFTVLYNSPPADGAATTFNSLELDTTEDGKKGFRVVGFEVEPFSVAHRASTTEDLMKSSCPVTPAAEPQELLPNIPVTFTYDVDYVASSTRWATRWDPLLASNPQLKQIQWFSILNSLMIALFLTSLVGTVMLRTVLRDFVRYNQLEDEDDPDDVSGWKLVHGDVFRTPQMLPLLAICVGNGLQTLFMVATTLAISLLGFLSPANRGGLLTSLLTLWVLASSVNGFTSARITAAYDSTGANRKLVTLGSALLFPGMSFSMFFVLNLMVWASGSSGAVPFFTLLLLLFMWFGVSMPLVFLGAIIGYKRKSTEFPVRTNQIPRQVPPGPLNIPQFVYILVAGIMPFGTVFMELVFLLNAVAQSQIMYVFGMLAIVFVILLITCAEVSIVFTYLTLSSEQWAWNWQAFLTCASSGLYMFLYTQYYLVTQPSFATVTLVSIALYSTYSLLMSAAFGLLTGSVGYLSSAWFVTKIYSNIHVS